MAVMGDCMSQERRAKVLWSVAFRPFLVFSMGQWPLLDLASPFLRVTNSQKCLVAGPACVAPPDMQFHSPYSEGESVVDLRWSKVLAAPGLTGLDLCSLMARTEK